jgi:hypothetical protein
VLASSLGLRFEDTRLAVLAEVLGEHTVDPSIRAAVRFEERNLADTEPGLWHPRAYDVVFGRNVLMYLVARIGQALSPGGYLLSPAPTLGSPDTRWLDAVQQSAMRIRELSLHLGLLARRGGDVRSARHEIEQALQLLVREDPSRILLFGGGFSREALAHLCRAELRVLGDSAHTLLVVEQLTDALSLLSPTGSAALATVSRGLAQLVRPRATV